MNLEKEIEEFFKYTSNFDMSITHLARKRDHSIRVMKICEELARKMKLNEEQEKLAMIIGLLHDIGRFEEYTVYYKYKRNEKIDHGDLGVEILKKDDYIKSYIKDNKYDDIILKAIKNHNKFKIEDGLSNEEDFYAKIIRDADKLDIFYECIKMFWIDKKDIEDVENSIASDDIMNSFRKCSIIKNEMVKSPLDKLISIIAFIFDINYKCSYNVMFEEKYLDRLLEKFNFEKNKIAIKQMEEIREITNEYLNANK